MTVPPFDPDTPGVPENVDNTNALTRRLVAELVAVSDVDVAAVLESMAAEGRLSPLDVTAVVDKGWITAKRIDDAVKPSPVDVKPVKG